MRFLKIPSATFSAPNQHQLFWACLEKSVNSIVLLLPGALPPHPLQNRVPRGERAPVALCCEPTEPTGETKSFCPCQKSQVSLLRYLTFSLVCGRIWQRGAPAGPPAVRVVGACSPVGCVQARPRRQPRPSPSAPATKPAETLGFCRFSFCMCCMGMGFVLVRTPGFPIRSHLFPTVPIPSSTQNAPGFAFSWLFRVRFSLFCWFTGAKFLVLFLCRLPFAGYKLKSLVIPPNRDVSFLT